MNNNLRNALYCAIKAIETFKMHDKMLKTFSLKNETWLYSNINENDIINLLNSIAIFCKHKEILTTYIKEFDAWKNG